MLKTVCFQTWTKNHSGGSASLRATGAAATGGWFVGIGNVGAGACEMKLG